MPGSPANLNRITLSAAGPQPLNGTTTPIGRRAPQATRPALRSGRPPRIGVIHNARARLNIGRHLPLVMAGCDHVMPLTHDELHDVLAGFVVNGIDTLIINGGDGTVRDILSALLRDFPAFQPRVAIVPSGKTNALALDLGIAPGWPVTAAIDAVVNGRVAERAPIEVRRDGSDRIECAGFIFGAGAFVKATQTAQQTHRFGAFNGLAVGLSIAAAVGQTIFGGANNQWRRGEPMRIALGAREVFDGPQYLVFASTLERLPLGIRPLGPARPGLKMLRIEAPPPRLALAAPYVLAGADRPWLARSGYHRHDAARIDISLESDFVFDGETFLGGDLSLRLGAPMAFVVP